jgi:hypothetical protein
MAGSRTPSLTGSLPLASFDNGTLVLQQSPLVGPIGGVITPQRLPPAQTTATFDQAVDYAAGLIIPSALTSMISQLISKHVADKTLAKVFEDNVGKFILANYDLTTKRGMSAFLKDASKVKPAFVTGLVTDLGIEFVADQTWGNRNSFSTALGRELTKFALQLAAGGARGGLLGADAAGVQAIIGDFIQIGQLLVDITMMNNQTRANLQTVHDQFIQLASTTSDPDKKKKYTAAAQQALDDAASISGFKQYLPKF